MDQDIIDQCRGVRDVNLCMASSYKQSQLRTFQHFYYKKKLSYYINNVSKKKKKA